MIKVCFVQQDPTIRVYQESVALKKHGGYELVLLCEKCDYELFSHVFDEIIYYGITKNNGIVGRILKYGFNKLSDTWNLPFIVRSMDSVDLFHVHAEPNNVPAMVIRNVKPVVFDAQDFSGISSGIENLSEKERNDEKYCMENSEGICHKGPSLEIEYYRQRGYHINCPEIQWMGGCNDDLFRNGRCDEVSLVYAGSLSPDKRYEYKYFIPTIKEIISQGINLHIYPSSPIEYKFKEYRNLTSSLFHFHQHVRYDKLSDELSKYKWGILFERDIRGDRYIDEKPKVGMATKIFSYMEAGIPIIVTDHLLPIKEFVESNKIGFSVKDSEINKIGDMIMKYDYEELKNNVLKVRNEWSLKNQSVHLDKFYSEVLK